VDEQMCSCEQKGILKNITCHVLEYSHIFVYDVEIIYDVAKYSTPCHGTFCTSHVRFVEDSDVDET
jgi:hypothetical protein